MADNPHVNDPRPVQDEPVATVTSVVSVGGQNGRQYRVYEIQWHADVDTDTKLYAPPQPAVQDERCFCDRTYPDADPDASCGDCPKRDYKPQDAARYRWLRAQHWDTSKLFVIAGGRRNVLLGTDCPCHDRLDEIIDAAMSAPSAGKESA